MSIQYRTYKGSSSGGPVDYSTVIATVSGLSYTGAALATPSRTIFAVRAYDTVLTLDDGNTDATVEIAISSTGTDITNVPDSPQAVTATPHAGGDILLTWTYPFRDAASQPTGFHVYQGPAGGPIDYGTVIATVAFGVGPLAIGGPLGRRYTATIPGSSLVDGTSYEWAIVAYNAHGAGDPLVITATSDATAPLNPINLTATVI